MGARELKDTVGVGAAIDEVPYRPNLVEGEPAELVVQLAELLEASVDVADDGYPLDQL